MSDGYLISERTKQEIEELITMFRNLRGGGTVRIFRQNGALVIYGDNLPQQRSIGTPCPYTPVKLSAPTSGGGVDGNQTSVATYKYVAKTLNGDVLYNSDTTPLDVWFQRENGSKVRATIGDVVVDPSNGTPKIWWCDEIDGTSGNCNS